MNSYSFYVLTHNANGSVRHVQAYSVHATSHKDAKNQSVLYYSSIYTRDGKPACARDGSYQTISKIVKDA